MTDPTTRLRQAEAIFHAALRCAPAERPAYLRDECAGDPDLLRHVEQLLTADARDSDFLTAPALGRDFTLPRPEDLDEPPAPRRIGPWQLVRLLGSGGMAHVWLARRDDEHVQMTVALKLIKRGMDTDAILARFRQERRLLARLDHPAIARLIDGGATDDGLPYLVMELVEGLPIDRYCAEHRLSLTQRIQLFLQVCDAVQYAHRNLVVHRDLKPGNILVTADGRPKLLDFGIAQLLDAESGSRPVTRDGRLLTPEYASPEQLAGEPLTTASDVYSLAVVLYELLTLQSPHAGAAYLPAGGEPWTRHDDPLPPSTAVRRAAQHHHDSRETDSTWPEGDPARLRARLRGDLDTILLMALRQDPAARYPSIEQLAEDLRRYLLRLPVAARAPTRLYRARRFLQRHRASAAAVAVALLAIVAGLIISTRAYFRAEAARKSEVVQRELARESQAAAEQEAARSAQVVRFLENMLIAANPAENKGNAEVTVRELLDQTAARLDSGDAPLAPPVAAVVHLTVGRTYLELSLLPQAEKHLRAALDLHRKHPDPHRQGVIQSLHALGRVLRITGRLAEAEECQREMLRVSRQYQAANEAFVAQGLNSLAILLRHQGKLDEAEATYRDAIAAYRRALGDDHPAVGDTLSNLGTLLLYRNRLEEAEPLLLEALALHRRSCGEESWEVVLDRQRLAGLRYQRGEHDAAINELRWVCRESARLHGPDHLTTAGYQTSLAGWLEEQGHLREAAQYYQLALATLEKRLPPDHHEIAATRAALHRTRQVGFDQGNAEHEK